MKNKKEPVPLERHETIRRGIISLIEGNPLSARDISGQVSISEKEVYLHLEHIRKTVNKSGKILSVTPPQCRDCGFVFKKRERLRKPGKCPVCKGSRIEEPLFSV